MNHTGTKTIETPRLLLRKFTMEDAEQMFVNWANDDEVTRFLTWPSHGDIETSRSIIRSWMEEYASEKRYEWCIEWKENGQAIGSISVVDLKENIEAVEIGYCIGRAYWQRGIVSEALDALIRFFFDEVGARRIESRHDPCNPNSGKVMLKCGMKYEGTRIKADKNNSGICDVSMCGIINPKFEI